MKIIQKMLVSNKLRKIIRIVLILMLFSISSDKVRAEEEFIIENNSLIEYTGAEEEVIIPDSVTSIGKEAFAYNKNVTHITIPESVITIEEGAFLQCSNLTDIIIPESVSKIGANAFYKSAWLEQKRHKSTMVIVNGIVVDGGTCKKYAVLPRSATTIGDGAFSYNKELLSITIPDSVTVIEKGAFANCTNLKKVMISNSVVHIEAEAFKNANKKMILFGKKGSYAQTYAQQSNLVFMSEINNTIEDVFLDRLSLVINVGRTSKLNLSNIMVDAVWESSDEEIATVDQEGVVKGLKSGATVITIYVNGQKLKCKVIVR